MTVKECIERFKNEKDINKIATALNDFSEEELTDYILTEMKAK